MNSTEYHLFNDIYIDVDVLMHGGLLRSQTRKEFPPFLQAHARARPPKDLLSVLARVETKKGQREKGRKTVMLAT